MATMYKEVSRKEMRAMFNAARLVIDLMGASAVGAKVVVNRRVYPANVHRVAYRGNGRDWLAAGARWEAELQRPDIVIVYDRCEVALMKRCNRECVHLDEQLVCVGCSYRRDPH